jgi:formyl-CoA transferase
LSWFHQTVNRNKRSLGLDLRIPAARDVLLRLVAQADLFVENFRPGTLDRWGIGYARCREVRPDLVMVSISGWGQYGVYAERGGYDPVIQAVAGWMSLNGDVDGEPMKAPTFLADDLAGLHAAIGALAALRHRDRTGEGQHVDVSMLDSLLFQSAGFLTLGATGVPLPRRGAETDFLVPSNRYRCADGHIYLTVALDRQWRALADVMGRPELADAPGFRTNGARLSNRDSVNAVVAHWCAPRPVADVIALLSARDLIAGPVRSFTEVAEDPHVYQRAMLQDIELCNGTRAPIIGPAVKFSRTPTSVRQGAPSPGQHTSEILDELAVGSAERDALRVAGAI